MTQAQLPALPRVSVIMPVLNEERHLAEAVQQIKHHTHRFVRHQYAWFRPADKRIEWFDLAQLTFAAMFETIL